MAFLKHDSQKCRPPMGGDTNGTSRQSSILERFPI